MTLPSDEIALLCELSATAQRARARQLYDLGWSLSAIGEALSPPRSRSTVRSWVHSSSPSSAPAPAPSHSLSLPDPPSPPPPPPPPPPPSLSPASSASSSLSSSFIGTAEDLNPSSAASAIRPLPPRRAQRRAFDPARPSISPDDSRRIAELAPLARRYRARANPDGAYALANEELTQLCCSLYDQGVSIRELAHAADVTYKAMERRVKPVS